MTRDTPSSGCDTGASYPRFTLAGKAEEDGARYFGPFGGRRETRLAIEAVCGALKLPICSRQFPRDIGRERPCLNHHIGRCDGFCLPGGPDQAEYRRRIRQAERIFCRPLPPADGGAANGDGGWRRRS